MRARHHRAIWQPNHPLSISVVLTAYNRASELRATLDDILSQTYREFELIICDDSSTDNTSEVCCRYQREDGRIRYIRNKTNLGMPKNLNLGVRAARGRYIANLHDGHRYHPRLLEIWSAALDAYPSCAFVFNSYVSLDEHGKEARIWREPLPPRVSGHYFLESVFFKRWRFDSPVYGTVMARRSAYEEVGLFDERFSYYADVDMWLRLAERYDVAYVCEPLIEVPSHITMPRLFSFSLFAKRRLLERMFMEARVRHYNNRPLRLAAEILRHGFYSLCGRACDAALSVRDAGLRRVPRE